MQPLQSVEPVQSEQSGGPSGTSPFMTAEQVAEILNVSPEHVRRAVKAHKIPGFTFGRAYRVYRSFVNEVLAEMAAGRTVVIGDYAATPNSDLTEGAA